MRINSNDLTFLVGDIDILENMVRTPVLPMLSEKAVNFLAALSKTLLHDKRVKSNIDVMSYAYWIRKASLENVKGKHIGYQQRLGRGVAFHIAPSNVPVNFAVSMTSSLLAGNCTLIRVSNKYFEQVDIICDAINLLLEKEFTDMKPYFCLVRYAHNERITQELSSICDIRIIWGGDQTIEEIRRTAIPSRAIEMAFADRHSIAIIDSDSYLNKDAEKIAKEFYTDTYYSDQNACSSPRLVVWVGNSSEKARVRFWTELDRLVKRDYMMKPIQAVDKYTSLCSIGMKRTGVRLISSDNYMVRVEVDKLTSDLMKYKNSGGYFFEYVAESLEEIIPIFTKQCQTVSVLGIQKERIRELVFSKGVRGVDRIVSLGETMGLEFIWDGYKMIENMSRFVYSGDY